MSLLLTNSESVISPTIVSVKGVESYLHDRVIESHSTKTLFHVKVVIMSDQKIHIVFNIVEMCTIDNTGVVPVRGNLMWMIEVRKLV